MKYKILRLLFCTLHSLTKVIKYTLLEDFGNRHITLWLMVPGAREQSAGTTDHTRCVLNGCSNSVTRHGSLTTKMCTEILCVVTIKPM